MSKICGAQVGLKKHRQMVGGAGIEGEYASAYWWQKYAFFQYEVLLSGIELYRSSWELHRTYTGVRPELDRS